MRASLIFLALLLLPPPSCTAQQLLVILEETGRQRDGLPVLRPSTGARDTALALSQGFSGRLLRVYRYEQNYLYKRGGPPPEPAYLLLSSNQGGFPRTGFYLNEIAKPKAGYVDLHKKGRVHGQFGAMDQIFPHELAHVLMFQTAGQPGHGGSNQLHAVGVRTDAAEAFSEGFAEHCQVLAIDDVDADPATRALANDPAWRRYASSSLSLYSKELTAPVPAVRWRLMFPTWFGQTDQILRYTAVRENSFAREPAVPDRLYETRDPYAAYLLANMLPGPPNGRPKNVARMLATEGVVSALFWQWVQSDALRNSYRDDTFYARFGAVRADVPPLENVYFKLIHAAAETKPRTTAEFIRGYQRVFPEDAAAVDSVVRSSLLGQALPDYAEIWLANPAFVTGSSLFDQFRGQPRIHTFDLNTASLADLTGVPGMTRGIANAILRDQPYGQIEDLQRVPGMTRELLERFRLMAAEMKRFQARAAEDIETGLKPGAILWPYAWRLLACLAAASFLGALLFRRVASTTRLRAGLAAVAASVVALGGGWVIGGTALTAIAIPAVFLGLPAFAWTFLRKRDVRHAAWVFAAWAAATLPAAVLSWPW